MSPVTQPTRISPCQTRAVGYATLLHVRDDGTVQGLQPVGDALIQAQGLNHANLRTFRCRLLALLKRIRRARKDRRADLIRWFGYPDDLPNLGARIPPDGNSLPAGVSDSHHERRLRGLLPDTY